MPALFPLGQTVATPGALEAFTQNLQAPSEFLARHQAGDWGDVEEADKKENDLSLAQGFRILSAYHLRNSTKIWIVTEADRSSTTVLLPEDY